LNTYTFKGVPFSAWLYIIAINEVNQHFRKANKNRVVALEDKFVDTIKYEFDNKEELEINIEKLSKVIQMLKPDEITIIELRFFEERPFKEVADILGLTETNAKVKVYRIVQKMKELFNGLNRD
jgi:RNA polymerase sigma-70 factor (ECF subfamily)